ncbi:FG-GAP repeat domain-containing protein [Opitutus terrae]|uniref:Tetratricopeptide TPR_2 repeat protein n=1 Tax=Opitutus terrae (strain DSM 11246 / JCM 15787 / PB90-1) TaxID=452637 RepID=B1ZY89_OPITP|nr:VCBS repeat-containing protein [Opitutus terrae]ACB76235.1 Tetratricopeptide TPR_2 repeat protein [Opitutus terrae PB90-1]
MSKRLIWISGAVLILVIAAALLWFSPASRSSHATSAEFMQLMTRGNGLLENGDAAGAIDVYTRALPLSPQSTDVRLNLANAYLLAERPMDAAAACRQVLDLDRNNAAAYYLLGCALLRQNQPEPAAEAFQQSWKIEPGIPALDFQMGMAQRELGHLPDAISLFESVVRAEPAHPSAHYQLSQLYRRVGRAEDATRELQQHQQILAGLSAASITVAALERCKHTQPLAPFVLAQPEHDGIAVRFADDTVAVFGELAASHRGPLAIVDYGHDGRPSLFVQDQTSGFVLLDNRAGKFAPLGRPLRVPADGGYRTALTGDLDNDGLDDVVVLGEQDSRVFKFYAQGRVRDATRAAGLEGLRARGGLLADLDFTGNLDLLVVKPDGSGLGVRRNLGNLAFDANWSDSGLPADVPGATHVLTEDWANEGRPGVFVARTSSAPVFFAKQRAAAFTPTELTRTWPTGAVIATTDFDNDLRAEACLATADAIEFVGREPHQNRTLPLNGFAVAQLLPVDYDNDGWIDLIACGAQGLRIWRNAGNAGFRDVTAALGLTAAGPIEEIVAADFDTDGDTDFVTGSEAGLRFWRNDGGNQNLQLKLRLAGQRSNTSALGVRVEVTAGNWRTRRTVRQNPLELGVGQHRQLDALKIRWFDLTTSQVDVPITREVHTVAEPTLPSGSCPYLYVWRGARFEFVTDILGAAPLGLPMSEKRFVAADPEELLALGNETAFVPRDGAYEIRITEELREALYLDEAHLIAVDHPIGTVVHPTSKMLPGPPFPQHALRVLRPLSAPHQATRSDNLDVTAALARIDHVMVSPVQLRRPQLRGLAEPYAVTLDFGVLAAERPLVLALTGWIRFGGGMANISGSIDPTLPFPFPGLEVELADGAWQKVDVVVGTPAGKTKTILVDLAGKLPTGARRLRLSTAYEIYWDAASLCEDAGTIDTREQHLNATRTDLRWHGYGRFADLPPSLPLTPLYDEVSSVPPWDRTPGGWFTRYGAVDELVARRDDRLALLAAGDELALSFDAAQLPPLAPGMTRDFFLHVVGWDKDADFHVEQGWRLEPFPYSGMDDQTYGKEARPAHLDDAWIKDYNTRWVDEIVPHPAGKPQPVP